MAAHVMTARRKAALRKAQLASARKRKKGRGKKAAAAVGVLGVTLAGYHAGKRANRALQPHLADGRELNAYIYFGSMSGKEMGRTRLYGYAMKRYVNMTMKAKREERRFKHSVKQTIRKL